MFFVINNIYKCIYNLRRVIMNIDSQKENVNKENLIFLNLPVCNEEDDVIGFNIYAENLSEAINGGAQMIAITSPFGAGKTSIIELLQENRTGNKREKIIKIPMWSHLSNNMGKNSSIELHKTLVYQIVSQINHNKGTYINRRFSSNYGLLKMHVNKVHYFFMSVIILLALAVMWLVDNHEEVFGSFFPYLESFINNFRPLLVVLLLVFLIVVLFRAEIIFSSKKSENERVIEPDEIIDIYRSEILKYNKLSKINFLNKFTFGKKYIIVIEDLDRIDDGDTVVQFLTELRKYYIPHNTKHAEGYKNSVVFITTIKPEEILFEDYKHIDKDKNNRKNKNFEKNKSDRRTNNLCLYDKIFDYVLNLQTINVDDYNAILEGILEPRREALEKIGLVSENKITGISGMQWIIRGMKIDIREIKYRLNKSLLLFQLLKKRFPEFENISYEKCAIAAYLTTTFEKEFQNTPHTAFKQLTDTYIMKGDLTYKYCVDCLKSKNEDYVCTVIDLIKSKHIDSMYHMYFYNYPKGSRMFTYEESVVQKAILYGESANNLNESLDAVINHHSDVIDESLEKIRQLKICLPEIVFQNEKLFTEALKRDVNLIFYWMENLDYSPEAFNKTKNQIMTILQFDMKRKIYTEKIICQFCNIWENSFKEKDLLTLRKEICAFFPKEILWYKQLFFGVHDLIREEEMSKLPLISFINLINIQNESFTEREFNYVIDIFCKRDYKISDYNIIKEFMHNSLNRIRDEAMAIAYIKCMLKTQIMESLYEQFITDLLLTSEKQKFKMNLFNGYQQLINTVSSGGLKDQTLRNICKLNIYSGYKASVAEMLNKKGFNIEAIAIYLENDININLETPETFNTLINSKEWLLLNEKYLFIIRKILIESDDEILLRYESLFQDDYPIVKKDEFFMLLKKYDNIDMIRKLIRPEQINYELARELIKFLNECTYSNNDAYDVLEYVTSFNKSILDEFFEKIDFKNSIKYDTIDDDQKNKIKQKLSNIIDLSTDNGKLSFMKTTKTLDDKWLSEMLVNLNKNIELQKAFIDVVNNCNKNTISKTTIDIICSFKSAIILNDDVLDSLFMYKEYECYAASKIYKNKKFEMEQSNGLWGAYVEIFTDDDYFFAREYMAENMTFLNELIKRKEYKGMTKDSRMILSRVLQDSGSLQHVIDEYDLLFAHQYYSQMKGFTNKTAAEKFLDIIEKQNTLLHSPEIYQNVYSKLDDRVLKAKYTRMRNNIKNKL